jgi:alanyl-tRNA synthetase
VSGGAATERLYYTDAYLPEFTARVVDRAEDGKRVYLDRTAFYPTSGGQLHDLGHLGDQSVVDVVDEDDRIAHVLAAPASLDIGREVIGKVDWTRRFDHMQQHTGQHLLSAVFEDLFGAKTVSVHFGDATSTLDLETDSMSLQSIEKAERRANLVIAENRAVSVTFEDAASAKGLRKAVDRTGTLRIVTIADLDRSACGGTHVRSTGEIGGLLIRGTERTRKALRVEFVCGLRAVARARADFQALTAIATSLSTSIDAVGPLVASQATQLKEAQKEKQKLERQVGAQFAARLFEQTEPLPDGTLVLRMRAEDVSDEMLRSIAMTAMERSKTTFVSGSGEGRLLVSTSEDSGRDAGKTLRAATTALGGKGGGSPRLAQGSVPEEKVNEALDLIHAALVRGQ